MSVLDLDADLRGGRSLDPITKPNVTPARRRVLATLARSGGQATRRQITQAEPITLSGRARVPVRKYPGIVVDDLVRLGWATEGVATSGKFWEDGTVTLTPEGVERLEEARIFDSIQLSEEQHDAAIGHFWEAAEEVRLALEANGAEVGEVKVEVRVELLKPVGALKISAGSEPTT